MKHKTKRNIFALALLGFICIGVYLYISFPNAINLSQGLAQEQNETVWYSSQEYLNKFNDSMVSGEDKSRNSINNRKQLARSFCQNSLSIKTGDSLGFQDEQMYYRPDRSIWLYMFCDYLKVDETDKRKLDSLDEIFDGVDEILVDTNNNGFELYQPTRKGNSIINACDTSTDMNSCNFVYDFPSLLKRQILNWEGGDELMGAKIDSNRVDDLKNILQAPLKGSINDLYNTILSEIFDLKQMGIYSLGDGDTQNAISNFSNRYFGDVCGDQNDYLGSSEVHGQYNFCSHPETYKNLKKYIKSAKSISENLVLFDKDTDNIKLSDKVISEGDELIDPASLNLGEWFACGFFECTYKEDNELKNLDSWNHFKKIMLNELMWYSMFATSYNTYLTNTTRLSPMAVGYDSIEDIQVSNTESAQQSLISLAKTQEATSTAYRNLTNFYMAFPIHIANQAYMEDINSLSDRFRHIYTPIHQLYYKLRNVQKKSN